MLKTAVFAIKIGLYTEYYDSINIGVSKGGVIIDAQKGTYLLIMNPMKPYKIEDKGNYIRITIDKKNYRIDAKEIIIKSTRDTGLVYTKKRWYRGKLIVLNTKKGLTVINDIDMENYIKGVVPSEMPAGWSIEAHKAQAIAARSYAYAEQGKRLRYGYDLLDTPQDQNYIGVSAETKQTNKAVDQTRGEVLVHNNEVIPAFYHASAGGKTLTAERVWGKDLPYTKSVKSFDKGIKKNGHRVGMSQHGANILAKKGYNSYQILGYFYNNVMLRRLY